MRFCHDVRRIMSEGRLQLGGPDSSPAVQVNTISSQTPGVGLDRWYGYGIMYLTLSKEDVVTRSDPRADKLEALRRHHALNPRPNSVKDPAFTSGQPFFDAHDLVQVKYEMLRSVRQNGRSATDAAASFGFSRPSFYQARAQFEEAGLPGLLPQRPGPKRAHKLSEEVVDLLEQALREDSSLSPAELVQMLDQQLGLKVHPRSVQRALERRRKKASRARA